MNRRLKLWMTWWLAVCLWAAMDVVTAGEEHIFLGPNGSTLEAEVLDFKDGNVEIRRLSDGQLFRLPANQLSQTDTDFMRGWLKRKEAAAHPLGWKKLRVHLPAFADEISAPGIPAAFRRIDLQTWEAELPEGAWLLVKIWQEDGEKFPPQFLLPFDEGSDWYFRYLEKRLTLAKGPKHITELVGLYVGSQDGGAELRAVESEISDGGLALSSEYLTADDFKALGKKVISAAVGEIDNFAVGKDARLRALKMDETMRDSSGLSGWDELELLDVRCSGDWPLADCSKLESLTTLVVDGDVSLASASDDGAFSSLRHLSLERAGIDDPDGFGVFAEKLNGLNSLTLPNEVALNISALAACQDLTVLVAGDGCGDPGAKGLRGMSKMSTLLLQDNYLRAEFDELVKTGNLSGLRTLGMGPRHTVALTNFPQLFSVHLKARGGEAEDDDDLRIDFAALGLSEKIGHLHLRNATAEDFIALAETPGAEHLPSLSLSYPSAEDFSALGKLSNLTWLEMRDQLVTVEEKLESLDVSSFPALRGLSLLRLQNLTTLKSVAAKLEGLSVRSCSELKTIDASVDSIADKVIVK